MPVFPSYRNQSIDLHRKSIDWFLYEGNTGIYCIKKFARLVNTPTLRKFKVFDI